MTLADAVRDWTPEPAEWQDTIDAEPVAALAGLLDQEPPGETLPPLWHWLFFLGRPAQHELGPDGHPKDGRFLPPVPDRRRMYAGGRWTAHAPIRIGDRLTRRSELAAVTPKTGRTGELLFTTVRHRYTGQDGTLVGVEEQDAVYRSGDPEPVPQAAPAAPPPATGPWRIELTADPALLFRFSALTYNAHRIHYDHAYATQAEGHAGLVVHGPLLALLLAELPRRAARPVRALEFRLRAPVYAGQPVTATGGPDAELKVLGPSGVAATMRWD
jgi:3-methylfumaryl-CoA hydratase